MEWKHRELTICDAANRKWSSSSWRDVGNAHCWKLARAEDTRERTSLEVIRCVQRYSLQERHTLIQLLIRDVRLQHLGYAAENHLVAVVIMEEQLEVVWKKSAHERGE